MPQSYKLKVQETYIGVFNYPCALAVKKKDEYSTRVEFIWDSGSDAHVVNDMSYYSSFKEQITIFDTVDGGKPVSALGNGDVVVRYNESCAISLP
ncbi:hypothetical protein JCM33374_g4059 [Metschnikowia sp. JCM 33374]|nr:hypothetical protein JCM33374_g4059 [Metschnikowia sp. JCM 33374]